MRSWSRVLMTPRSRCESACSSSTTSGLVVSTLSVTITCMVQAIECTGGSDEQHPEGPRLQGRLSHPPHPLPANRREDRGPSERMSRAAPDHGRPHNGEAEDDPVALPGRRGPAGARRLEGGDDRSPGWYRNLKANSEVKVQVGPGV